MAKIIVSIAHPVSDDKRAAIIKRLADDLGVLAENVVVVPHGVSVSVVEIPADLVKARHDVPAAVPVRAHTAHARAKE